jgi:Na+-transporting NADH:ubiquinone oxidoreductase subunit A
MGQHSIRKGLDLPIAGAPSEELDSSKSVRHVAVAAADYVGMRPTLYVEPGQPVRRGEKLFEDKKRPGVAHTAPGAGTVTAINRGARRMLQTVVLELNDNEVSNSLQDGDYQPFEHYTGKDLALIDSDQVRKLLVESGLWTAFRTRPFSRQPFPDTKPAAIFITASDSAPLAPSMDRIAEGREEDLSAGCLAVAKLTDGRVYFCKKAGSKIKAPTQSGVLEEEFSGPHPSGTAGLHIHLLEGVHREKMVWVIGLQDVLSIGALFRTGRLDVTRIIALAGPGVKNPRLLKTRLGASIDELVEGELARGAQRVLSGSVLAGRKAMGEVLGYLGRCHNQISCVPEGGDREFLGWMMPGGNKFSITNLFTSRLKGSRRFNMTTSANGSPRAIVPFGLYEKVMPMDILPTFLLRSLCMDDLERSEQLGCLELEEEDLALCSFVCPGKTDFGPILRRNLTTIEKEG